jgi:amidase
MWPAQDVWISQLATEGPMGRSVKDVAMLLSVQAGYHPASPLSIAQDGSAFTAALDLNPTGQRIGWLGDLKGYLPMQNGVLDTCAKALKSFESMGCHVDTAELGMDPAKVWEAWSVRAWRPSCSRLKITLKSNQKHAGNMSNPCGSQARN